MTCVTDGHAVITCGKRYIPLESTAVAWSNTHRLFMADAELLVRLIMQLEEG